MNDAKNHAQTAHILMRERERERYKPSLILFVLLAFAAALLTACPPEAKTDAKAQSPNLSITYCGIEGIAELTLVMGKKHGALSAGPAASWSSSDAAVSVAADGAITLNSATIAGKPVVITAASGGKTASLALSVLAANGIVDIEDETDLRAIACGLDGLYELKNDIQLTREWEPIGTTGAASNQFSGTLDGAGYTIKNLFINKPNTENVGLIGINGAGGEVKNIGVEVAAAGIIGGPSIVGALVGANSGRVSGVATGGAVTVTSGQVGGLVGANYAGGFVTGYADVAVNGQQAGGLVGNNFGTAVGYAEGNVNAANSNAGGLVGSNNARGTATGYATGKVQGGYGIGGFVGVANGTIIGYARGVVTAKDNSVGAPTDLFGEFYGRGSLGTGSAGYFSDGESRVVDQTSGAGTTGSKGVSNGGGKRVTIDATKTQKGTDYFDEFTFGTADGQWTFRNGKWPAINLPANESIFNDYRPALQP